MVKIKSITDVVTNSSSEVFILQRDDAYELERDYPFITVSELSLDSIEENSWFSDLYSWAVSSISNDTPYLSENIDNDGWREFIKKHQKAVETLVEDYVEVDIEDNYEGWDSATDEARSCSIASKNCH